MRSTFNYNGPLCFLLLGRIVDETLFLGLGHGPIFYSPTVSIKKSNKQKNPSPSKSKILNLDLKSLNHDTRKIKGERLFNYYRKHVIS